MVAKFRTSAGLTLSQLVELRPPVTCEVSFEMKPAVGPEPIFVRGQHIGIEQQAIDSIRRAIGIRSIAVPRRGERQVWVPIVGKEDRCRRESGEKNGGGTQEGHNEARKGHSSGRNTFQTVFAIISCP